MPPRPKIKFPERAVMFVVSTGALPTEDLELILAADAPCHIANHDDFVASIFYISDDADYVHVLNAMREFGLSQRFIEIYSEARRQKAQYLMFHADGPSL